MDTVAVLMSTYNGEKFLKEQIESILAQKGVNVRLIVRDDGSTDSTLSILCQYQQMNKLTLIKGKNIGPTRSFIELLFLSPKADYYSFSDQDDVWDDDKLRIAIHYLKNDVGASLYHCVAGVVNENLKPIPYKKVVPVESFPGSLLTSATGCTIVFNQDLMDYLRIYKPNCRLVSMHDVWVYRVSYAVNATVHYDNRSHMKYRQHESNYTGGVNSYNEKLKRMLFTRTNTRSRTCQEVIKGYSKYMSKHNLIEGRKLANYNRSIKDKLKLLVDNEIKTNYFKTNLQIKVLILLGKL